MPILASNHSLGDETVDTMDQVNIDSNNTHSGKDGELNWENYFSNKQQAGSKVAARAGQQQERFYQARPPTLCPLPLSNSRRAEGHRRLHWHVRLCSSPGH
eukprot:768649-Hanusia_phi.AAC.3